MIRIANISATELDCEVILFKLYLVVAITDSINLTFPLYSAIMLAGPSQEFGQEIALLCPDVHDKFLITYLVKIQAQTTFIFKIEIHR